MTIKKHKSTIWLCASAVLTIVTGVLLSAWICNNPIITSLPTRIKNIYSEERIQLSVPGSTVANLSRTGAYGIYYENKLVSSIQSDYEVTLPPVECSITSASSGEETKSVPDYVRTNQYWSKERGLGFLIMSITVDRPGSYSFACQYLNGRTDPKITVSLGPNYLWEPARVLGKAALLILAAAATFLGSILTALTLLFIAFIKQRSR